ncbi:MAG: hypothetical protein JWO86_835 [Myxococcaceae bacterium]|nr:hypothetical protein [Myxococcaceae bacterium]
MPNHFVPASALFAVAMGLGIGAAAMFAGCSGGDPGPTADDGGTSSTASSSGNPGTSSGTSGSSGGTSGAGTSGTGTSGTSGAGTSGGQTFDQCISACEAQYPKGVALGDGIDQCWAKSCSTDCNALGAGMQFPAAHGMCKNLVETPGAACSQCTVDHCCAAWDACFDNADCTALNKCSIACYK